MSQLTEQTALIIIDVQEGLDDPALGERNNPDAEQNMQQLLAAWRANGRPIFHVQHMSTEPNSTLRPELPGNRIKEVVRPLPTEPLFQKSVNSAFIGTDLEAALRAAGCETVVIVGLTTDHCISTSVRMAENLGFRTIVVSDATAAFGVEGHDGIFYTAEQIHTISLATLNGEFATVIDTESVLAALG